MTLDLLHYGFMQRALLASLLVGMTAPSVGVYIVQRRLALIGDGMGHVALAGVALGVLTTGQPVLTALVTAVVGAVVIELVRARGRTSGDVALAVMFYGGIAAGVVIISRAPGGTPANLNSYLFGAITTTSRTDLVVFAVLAVLVLTATIGLAPRLFAVSNDEEYARAAGLPVLGINLLLAVITATTVVISMRVVGLLLISALMVVPVATAQLLVNSFRSTLVTAIGIGVAVSLGGTTTSYYANTPSGGTIVLLAIAIFTVAAVGTSLRSVLHRNGHDEAEDHLHRHGEHCGHLAVPHDDHVDYVHDGHRHAPHGEHYDEHYDEPEATMSSRGTEGHP
jgi:zinc transport system permease protein